MLKLAKERIRNTSRRMKVILFQVLTQPLDTTVRVQAATDWAREVHIVVGAASRSFWHLGTTEEAAGSIVKLEEFRRYAEMSE